MTNTIIELRHSYVTGNVPTSLANGELAINTYDGKLFYRGGASNTIQSIERYEGPAGLDGEVQFNDSGTLGSDSGLTYDKTTDILTVTGSVISGGLNLTPTLISAYAHANAAFAQANTGGGGGGTITLSPTPPSGNSEGDIWIDSDDGAHYTWVNDNSSYQWVEFGGVSNEFVESTTDSYARDTANAAFEAANNASDLTSNITIGTSVSNNIILNSTITGNLLPTSNIIYDLGSNERRWKDLYLSGDTIDLGGASIKTDSTSGSILLIPPVTQENPNPKAIVISPSGGVATVDTTGGTISQNDLSSAANANTTIASLEAVNLTQNTNITNLEGVNVTQNTNITVANNHAWAAFGHANSAFDAANNATDTYVRNHANASFDQANTNADDIVVLQGVNLTQNTNISNLEGVNTTQNTNITNAQNSADLAFVHANAAFGKANTGITTSGGSISGSLNVSSNVWIGGNLIVAGSQTVVDSTIVQVADNIVTLNSAIDQASAPVLDAGIEIDRGSSANVSLLWNESSDKWTATNDGTNYFNIGADTGEVYANAAFLAANTAQVHANYGFNHANASFGAANTNATAITALQGVNLTQNTSITNLEGVNVTQNTSITNAQNSADAAFGHANSAFDAANNATDTYVRAHANSAFDHANAAFETANSSGGGGGSSDVILNNSIISSNITIQSGKNGLVVGPITMNANLSIVVASGQRFIIL